jgi:hypothetical protein
MKIIKNWILPLTIAIALFLLVRPTLAQVVATPKDPAVGVESVDGYTQVYFDNSGTRQFITSGNINSSMPVSAGSYIVYVSDINGEGQIFLYDATSGTKTQLTFIGTNLNPKVDEKGRAVWEGWDGSTWQVFFFDGLSTIQLTTGDTSLNPEISEDYISYGRRDVTGTWRAVVYSIKEGKSVDVVTGEKSRKPTIRNGDIYLGTKESEEKFSLKVSDLFLLDFTSINQSTESANPILEELSATPSGVMEIPISTDSAVVN